MGVDGAGLVRVTAKPNWRGSEAERLYIGHPEGATYYFQETDYYKELVASREIARPFKVAV